jgi:hypothetical protein
MPRSRSLTFNELSRRHTETRVAHLCCRDQRRHNSDEAFRPCLQLKCAIEDRRACLQILQSSLQKSQQRRQAWKVCKRPTNYHSISQVDTLPDLGTRRRGYLQYTIAAAVCRCNFNCPLRSADLGLVLVVFRNAPSARFCLTGLRSSLQSELSCACRTLLWTGHSVVVSADATIPSGAAAGVADGSSGHAGTINDHHTRPAAHTCLCDHRVRLMNWRERHRLRSGSEGQPEHNNSYCSHHCFLPVTQNSFCEVC